MRKEDETMINENIKKFRKEKGFSQEEMAVKLHVVRQTVSKWEKGLSVPDAEVLIRMAEILDVSVNQLLGIESKTEQTDNLADELARLNEILAEKNKREVRSKRANEKRGLILLLSFVSMMVMLSINLPMFSILLSGGCILVAVVILYRNLALMTSVTTDDMRLKVLRVTTVFNILILVAVIAVAVLTAADIIHFSEDGEKLFSMLLIAGIMIFAGIVSPKLPFTRHTGLRLPWTVQDQETWEVAHRILGYISLPIALLYIACSLTLADFETITLIAFAIWLGIPGGISFMFYRRKMNGRLW